MPKKAERREDCMEKYLKENLLGDSHNGLINDVEIVFIDKTDPSDPMKWKQSWRTKLKTSVTHGLNMKEWVLITVLWKF